MGDSEPLRRCQTAESPCVTLLPFISVSYNGPVETVSRYVDVLILPEPEIKVPRSACTRAPFGTHRGPRDVNTSRVSRPFTSIAIKDPWIVSIAIKFRSHKCMNMWHCTRILHDMHKCCISFLVQSAGSPAGPGTFQSGC